MHVAFSVPVRLRLPDPGVAELPRHLLAHLLKTALRSIFHSAEALAFFTGFTLAPMYGVAVLDDAS
jgi:hypothetical protein